MMPTFGNTSIKATASIGWSGTLAACKYSLPEGGTIESISLYCAVAAGNVRLAIYSDSAGEPDALQCEADPVAVSVGWNTLTPTTTPTLPAGDYWLAWQLSDDATELRHQAGTTNQECDRAYAWGAFPDPFGTPATYRDRDKSLYATYSIVVVGAYAAIF